VSNNCAGILLVEYSSYYDCEAFLYSDGTMCGSPICNNISLQCCELSSSGQVKSKLKLINMLDKHVYLYFLKVAGLDPSKVLKYEGN
jgi:hypothetical protein